MRLVALALLCATAPAAADTRLLRFPDIHGDRVVFTYAGDLWTASTSGGSAVRLTAHPGLELFAKFSPDGKWIAFTGQYEGDEQVYVVPAAGGIPQQLTFYPSRGPLPDRWGYDHQVYGWTPDGAAVLFRSYRETWDLGDSRLYTVPVAGGLPTALPMPRSGAGDLSPDGRKVVYSPLFRDFRSWKRYQGGWATDLWIFDLDRTEARQITDHVRSDRDPMWVGDSIVFNSDRSGTFDLYRLDQSSGSAEALTSESLDVRWPSSDGTSQIVYELGGALAVLDLGSGTSRQLSIEVPTDGVASRPERVAASGNIENFALAPKGERALFAARGDIFSAPIEHGPTRNLTRSTKAHDRLPRWSPDGTQVLFVSDQSGEEELWVVDASGAGAARQLTNGAGGRIWNPQWSPDGKWVAWSEQSGKLLAQEIASKRVVEIDDEPFGRLTDWEWSPCSSWIAYTRSELNGRPSVFVWNRGTGATRAVTGSLQGESTPSWDPQGRWLFYVAARELSPQISSFEWNYATDRTDQIYALVLQADGANPLPTREDQVARADKADKPKEEKSKEDKPKGDADKPAEATKPIRIDFDGLETRVVRIPVDRANVGGLVATGDHLLWNEAPAFVYGGDGVGRPQLVTFSFDKRERKVLTEGPGGWTTSHDRQYVLTRDGASFRRFKIAGGEDKAVSTAGLEIDRVPKDEWENAFYETWRRFRDFFYVENMHGYDWQALRGQYAALLPHVGHRSDLNYVIAEMIAELNIGHAYIAGGDMGLPSRPRAGLLGAEFALDPQAGRYRIAKILPGDPHEDRYRSPLSEVGLGVAEGNYLFSIDGRDLGANDNPYAFLRHVGSGPVEIEVGASSDRSAAKRILVTPIGSEAELRYLAWVEGNRRQVAEATNGRVGYLHIPDMGPDGLREFIKYFYGQLRAEGLVVDVRGNGGGNVSQMLIERLRRELLGLDFVRGFDAPMTYPSAVFHGSMVCLLNETSASDGDIFPWTFREAGLGPLIGKRSWGGIIGITNHGPLIDGGSVSVPEFGNASAAGAWVVEGHGVDPDIVVENDPVSVIQGRDPQLERGIQEVLALMAKNPKALPPRPADPVKTP
jgi:tricorn protease